LAGGAEGQVNGAYEYTIKGIAILTGKSPSQKPPRLAAVINNWFVLSQ